MARGGLLRRAAIGHMRLESEYAQVLYEHVHNTLGWRAEEAFFFSLCAMQMQCQWTMSSTTVLPSLLLS